MSEPEEPADRYEHFLELFARHRSRIFAYIYALLPHQADAEDVFQRCSIILWRKFNEFEPDAGFLPWACGVAFYEVRNFMRTAQRDRLQFSDETVKQLAQRRLDQLDGRQERIDALRDCLKRLRGAERRLIEQVYDSDRSIKDVALSTGQAVQTLYNQLSQTRRKLYECVQRTVAAQG